MNVVDQLEKLLRTEVLNNEDKLNQMRKNTESLAKKNSTMDICRTILIQQKPG